MKGAIGMHEYKWRKTGIVISALGLILMIAERFNGFIVFKNMNSLQHSCIFENIMLFGLIVIIYTKEKYDDERVKQIRAKSFQIAFTLQLSLLIAQAFTGTVHPTYVIGVADLLMYAGSGIVVYLFVYNIGLHFDFLFEYGDKTVMENLRSMDKNIWAKLIYIIGCTILFLLLALLYPEK